MTISSLDWADKGYTSRIAAWVTLDAWQEDVGHAEWHTCRIPGKSTKNTKVYSVLLQRCWRYSRLNYVAKRIFQLVAMMNLKKFDVNKFSFSGAQRRRKGISVNKEWFINRETWNWIFSTSKMIVGSSRFTYPWNLDSVEPFSTTSCSRVGIRPVPPHRFRGIFLECVSFNKSDEK